MATIANLIVNLGLNSVAFATGCTKAEARGRGLQSVLGGIGKMASLIGVSVGIGALTTGMIELAASAEQTEVAFSTILKSRDAAKALLGELRKFGAETPFEFPELATASKSLLAFGVDAGRIVPTLRAIGDVSSGIGAPIGDIAELYGKARVQGRLFGEDINQLTGRGIPIIQELAKQFGVAENEVKGLVESGKVNFGHLEKAFISMTTGSGQFTGMMEAQSQTLTGQWSTLMDTLKEFGTSIGTILVPPLKLLIKLATMGLNLIKGLFKVVYSAIVLVVTAVTGTIAQIAAWIPGLNQVSEFFSSWTSTLVGHVQGLWFEANSAGDALAKVGAKTSLPKASAEASKTAKAFKSAGESFDKLKKSIEEEIKSFGLTDAQKQLEQMRSQFASIETGGFSGADRDAMKELERLQATLQAKKNQAQVEESINDLLKQRARFGFDAVGNTLADMRELGATPKQLAKAEGIAADLERMEKQKKVLEDLAKAEEEWRQNQKRAAQTLFEQTRTPLEQFEKLRFDYLNLFKAGAIDENLLRRGIGAAQKDLLSGADRAQPNNGAAALERGSAAAISAERRHAAGRDPMSNVDKNTRQQLQRTDTLISVAREQLRVARGATTVSVEESLFN